MWILLKYDYEVENLIMGNVESDYIRRIKFYRKVSDSELLDEKLRKHAEQIESQCKIADNIENNIDGGKRQLWSY